MNLLILAAGLGTRLKPITHKIPKPALPILNVPMLLWNYFYFKDHLIQNCVVNTFHLEDILRQRLSLYNSRFIFSSDGKEVLGTGGGISNNKDLLITSPNFWVINGDGFFLAAEKFVKPAEELHLQKKALATLIVCEHPDVGTKFGGVWVDSQDKVLTLGRTKPAQATKGYHFTGFRILSKDIFNLLPTLGAHEIFDTLNVCLKQGHHIEILKVKGEFFETGNKEDFLKTNQTTLEYFRAGDYSSHIRNVIQTFSPNSDLNPSDFLMKLSQNQKPEALLCDEKLRIFEGTQLQGFCISGKNVTIRENCHLENVILLDNQDIPANSTYKNEILY